MRDILLKIIEKLHSICTALAETNTVISDMGKTVFTTTVTIAEDTTVNAGASTEIIPASLSTILPEGARFISATLQGGTTPLMGLLILHEIWWGNSNYIGVTNPTSSAITIPAEKTVLVVYAK